MRTTGVSSVVVRLASGVMVTGLLSSCGGEVSFQVPDVSDDVQEAINGVREDIDFDLSVDEQVRRLQEEFCEAQGSSLAESMKGVVEALHEEIVQDNPGVAVPPLDLDPDKCA